jgi:outer membrane protein assembly factor BamB
VWKRDELGTGWSSPVINRDRIFITGDVGDDLVVFALDRDGQQLWRAVNGQSWQGSYPGARASCCYSEERLYHLNAHGRLAALDADTGQELWHVDILERFDAENITWALSECVVVDGEHVIVTPGGRAALMAALDKRDGTTRWATPALKDDLTSYSSPILFACQGRRVLANCSSAHGFGVDADSGELLWTVPLSNQHKVNTATPIYGTNAIYYVTPYGEEGRLYGLELDQPATPVRELWRAPVDTVTGSGVLVEGTFFTAGYRKNKWWMAIDWATGAIRSELKDLTTGAAIYADGRLYCLDDRGAVGLIAVQGGELRPAGKFQLVQKRVQDAWAHPVLLDGRLYVRYHDTLYCYDVAR